MVVLESLRSINGVSLNKVSLTGPKENEMGIDIDQLLFNLSLSPELRLAHHQAAQDLIWELENTRRMKPPIITNSINEAKSP